LLCVALAACGPENNNANNGNNGTNSVVEDMGMTSMDADVDAGMTSTDMSDVRDGPDMMMGDTRLPPRPLSPTVLQTIQQLSPEGGVAPPVDTTNQYADDERAVRLGQFIFYEPSISGNGGVSCASCHQPDYAFTDTTPTPTDGVTGPANAPGRRTPSLLNTGYNKWQFWDGRVDTLWGQATAPYESMIEMGGSRLQLAHYVYETPEVKQAYEDIFGPLPDLADLDPFPDRGRPFEAPSNADEETLNDAWLSMEAQDQEVVTQILVNVMKAVAAFEMKLVSLDSPFDQFVDQVRAAPDAPEQWDAMSRSAQEGMRLFIESGGCLECHKGPMFTDNKFHNLGAPQVDWADSEDPGRVVGLEQAKVSPFSSAGPYSDDPDGDRAGFLLAVPRKDTNVGAFKTPTLRNVAKRAPYLHAGHHEDLAEVMEFYNEPPEDAPVVGTRDSKMRALEFENDELDHLVEFMKSLDGEPVPDEYKSQPSSPLPD
jgi:cytochrome c peroxidase